MIGMGQLLGAVWGIQIFLLTTSSFSFLSCKAVPNQQQMLSILLMVSRVYKAGQMSFSPLEHLRLVANLQPERTLSQVCLCLQSWSSGVSSWMSVSPCVFEKLLEPFPCENSVIIPANLEAVLPLSIKAASASSSQSDPGFLHPLLWKAVSQTF